MAPPALRTPALTSTTLDALRGIVREELKAFAAKDRGSIDQDALREMIRDELASAATARQPAQTPANPVMETVVASLTPQQREAYSEMGSMVDRAVSRGTWTDEDRAHFMDGRVKIPGELALEMTQRLIVAVNAGQVQVAAQGMPF